jgi:hypothetical protein
MKVNDLPDAPKNILPAFYESLTSVLAKSGAVGKVTAYHDARERHPVWTIRRLETSFVSRELQGQAFLSAPLKV